jgi:hypothetical protein
VDVDRISTHCRLFRPGAYASGRYQAHDRVTTMRLAVIFWMLLGCAGAPRPAGQTASAFDQAAVKARSHLFYAAIDQFDSAGIAAVVAPSSCPARQVRVDRYWGRATS